MKKLILLLILSATAFSGYSQTTDSTMSTQPPPAPQVSAPAPATAPASTQPPPAAPTQTTAPAPAAAPGSTQTTSPAAAPAAAPSSTQTSPAAPSQTTAPAQVSPASPAAAAPAKVASNTNEAQWKFGLHATPSIKWLTSTNDEVKTDGAQVGFSYGLVAEYFFQSRYSFCSGIDFAYRGGKLKGSDTTDFKYSNNIQYFEIPITIKMHTNEKDKKLFYAKFGVSPGWNIGRSGDNLSAPTGGTDPDDLNGFYMALKIGGGMEYEISDQTMLFGGLVWNNGFTDAFKGDFDAKNKSIELEIGILF